MPEQAEIKDEEYLLHDESSLDGHPATSVNLKLTSLDLQTPAQHCLGLVDSLLEVAAPQSPSLTLSHEAITASITGHHLQARKSSPCCRALCWESLLSSQIEGLA